MDIAPDQSRAGDETVDGGGMTVPPLAPGLLVEGGPAAAGIAWEIDGLLALCRSRGHADHRDAAREALVAMAMTAGDRQCAARTALRAIGVFIDDHPLGVTFSVAVLCTAD